MYVLWGLIAFRHVPVASKPFTVLRRYCSAALGPSFANGVIGGMTVFSEHIGEQWWACEWGEIYLTR